jgi:hypothetical protein
MVWMRACLAKFAKENPTADLKAMNIFKGNLSILGHKLHCLYNDRSQV